MGLRSFRSSANAVDKNDMSNNHAVNTTSMMISSTELFELGPNRFLWLQIRSDYYNHTRYAPPYNWQLLARLAYLLADIIAPTVDVIFNQNPIRLSCNNVKVILCSVPCYQCVIIVLRNTQNARIGGRWEWDNVRKPVPEGCPIGTELYEVTCNSMNLLICYLKDVPMYEFTIFLIY